MAEKRIKYGEDYQQHVKRAAQARHDVNQGVFEDSVDPTISPRTVSSMEFSEAVFGIELEAMIETNPNISEEERAVRLAVIRKLNEAENERVYKERLAKREKIGRETAKMLADMRANLEKIKEEKKDK